jgi:putative oxidoreductase
METLPVAVATAPVVIRYRIPALASLYEGLAPLAEALVWVTATVHHLPRGFFWNEGGFEYPRRWSPSFVIRGGGRYSADGALGREF